MKDDSYCRGCTDDERQAMNYDQQRTYLKRFGRQPMPMAALISSQLTPII